MKKPPGKVLAIFRAVHRASAPKGLRAVATGGAKRNPWNPSSIALPRRGRGGIGSRCCHDASFAPPGQNKTPLTPTGYASLHPWLQSVALRAKENTRHPVKRPGKKV